MGRPRVTRSQGAPRRTRWIALGQGLLLLSGSLLFCALCLEVALRVAPELFGMRTANALFSRYTTKPGGIYFYEWSSDMFFMHPDFETTAYFNGYRWHHVTDARGFRNPAGRPVDGTLLLGDSLVYGHGVEEQEGLASQLESDYGRDVYNLSRQGDSLYQHYVLLRAYLEPFRPETVVIFVFHNDYQDLLNYRGIERLEEAPELERQDYDRLRQELAARESNPHSWSRLIRYRSLTYRLFLVLRSRIQRAAEEDADAALGEDAAENPLDRPLLDPHTYPVLRRYFDRILADLAERCDAVGARLVVINLDAYPTATSETAEAKERARQLLVSATDRHGIAFFDTGDLITACEACVLPSDGHLTEEGHRRLAAFVASALDSTR